MKPIAGGVTGGQSCNMGAMTRSTLPSLPSNMSPKPTHGGADLTRNATNSKGQYKNQLEGSPSALKHSANQWPATGNY